MSSWLHGPDPDVPTLEDAPAVDHFEDPFPEIDAAPVFYVAGRGVFHADRACMTLAGSRRRSAGGTAHLPETDVEWGPCPICIGVVGGDDGVE